MKITPILDKLSSENSDPVSYFLEYEDKKLEINTFLNKKWSLKYTGQIFCTNCGKKTKKSFSQGHCYPCSIKLASCDMCILKPETCHFHLGTCREPEWGKENCFKPHIIYLSYTSGYKVGITRKSQIPFRWIDQGATQASMLFEVTDRLTSGKIETLMKEHIADKTDFRKMLKGSEYKNDFAQMRKSILNKVRDLIKEDYKEFDDNLTELRFPVEIYPDKISSINLEKNPTVEGVLKGIKGQYLIFDNGVLNVRSHSGYQVEIEIEEI